MRIPRHVYAWVALAAGFPSVAAASVTVWTTTIQAPAGDVPPGSTVSVICQAQGDTTSGMGGGGTTTTIDRIDVSVSGGTVTPASLTGAQSRPCIAPSSGTCSWLEGTANWTTPATAGTYTATCTAYSIDTDWLGPKAGETKVSSASLTTVNVTFLPPVVGAVTGPAQVATGATAVYEVAATDPNGWPLTYTWTATAGTITPDATNPARAAWTAPQALGAQTLTVRVSNGPFSVNATKSPTVVLATYQSSLPVTLSAPRRLTTGDAGRVFVVDGRQGTQGSVGLLSARGETRGFATIPEPARASAYGAGYLWVVTSAGNVWKVDAFTGQTIGTLPLSDGPLAGPAGVAFEPTRMTLWIADNTAGRVRVVRLDGTTFATIRYVNGVALDGVTDVAIDAAGGKAWVMKQSATAETDLAPGQPIQAARFLHAFDLDAAYLASYVPMGGAPGQISRAGGVTVGADGKVYVSDTYQGTILALDRGGTALGTIGTFGSGQGQLTNPTGLTPMSNGDVLVANTTLGRVERFGTGVPLPTCAGDSDCDGLSDAWEIAHGLDPLWAGDALLDLDGDGLNNAAELVAGTNPANRDTDGDGYSDFDELASGFDPLNPHDHDAMVAASGPAETPPGLVKLHATATGPVACTVAWTQSGGAAVALAGADSGAPTFVARAAGTYSFDAVATCGTKTSVPSRATVVVRNVPPMPEAGGVIVAVPGTPVHLDANASSDANGEALSFQWDQTLGVPTMGTRTDGAVAARPRATGYYAFQVTVRDAGGNAPTAEVPVLVAEGLAPTAIAAAFPADAEVGQTVTLDASTSVVYAGSAFSWRQLSPDGSPVTIAGANQAIASFVPATPGRYVFDVVAGSGPMRTPAAKVEVYVAPPGGVLPAVTATAPSVVAVGQPVALEATPSPSSAQVTWRQLSGPAAGLTEAGSAVASVVPFAPGFHVFEAAVKDGTTDGHPVRVAFEARVGGAAIPQASVTRAPGDAWVGQLVFLDGRASTGAARFRWSQVAGPWVAFGMQSSIATFTPLAVGLYAFELVVDDGVTRSAPARIEVNVIASEVR